jgi:hypothetical protein
MYTAKRQRKTVNIQDFRKRINELLASGTVLVSQKEILCSVLEEILMDTGNYQGFQWTMEDQERGKVTKYGDEDFFNRQYL